MDAAQCVIAWLGATGLDPEVTGRKAAVLAALAAADFPVPPGFVVTCRPGVDPSEDLGNDGAAAVVEAADRIGPGPYAVRSSAAAEDLPDASYAGLYETYLNVDRAGLLEAIRRCFGSAHGARVTAYRAARCGPGDDDRGSSVGSGLAVLVQPMVDAAAAGVAFTAHPVTGSRDETVVTAVVGLGEPLVSGRDIGEEWTVRGGRAVQTRPGEQGRQGEHSPAITAFQAIAVSQVAGRVAHHFGGPQDIEWAIDHEEHLYLLQARAMTALPDPVEWVAPGPGWWMRNFRLGEWLPEAATPLFASWLLPRIETGYLDGVRTAVGAVVPFRYATVNGWYYNALPIPTARLLARVIVDSRGRAPWFLYNALFRVSRDPVAADRAVLADLEQSWRSGLLPGYRHLIEQGEGEVDTAAPLRLVELIDEIGGMAGQYLWSLAILGGSAWKMEGCLTAFCRRHQLVPVVVENTQVLLRGLPGTEPVLSAHAVESLDWYRPTAGEISPNSDAEGRTGVRHREVAAAREEAERAVRAALRDRPRLLARFDGLLDVTSRYTVLREQQARDFTLGWPLLRRCLHRLGEHLTATCVLADPGQIFFLTRDELATSLTDRPTPHAQTATQRRAVWDRQRRLVAPLTLGVPTRLIGDPIARAVTAARGTAPIPAGAIVGHPASPGRATGPVRIVTGPQDVMRFTTGEVLVAKATAPAWTPLFAQAAAVVTDGGTLAAHASLVAREYGIPAVVATTDATTRLRTGQIVTVDGGAGTVQVMHDPTDAD